MPNSWYRQAYVQVFDCEYINFKKDFNMFEPMEIAESIYEGLVEPSYYKIYPGRRQPCWSQQAKERITRLTMD